ncbi:MAG: M1 family metallopeptidase [Fidelibacterota bacterium]|nr:MAG: M1 family metallopeptidase [Candidatus Neomarinimicrobiota bacterium]
MRIPLHFTLITMLVWTATGSAAQRHMGAVPTSSGGPLLAEQAAYDVTCYDLALAIDTLDKAIEGQLRVHADVVRPLEWFVLDLDTLLEVAGVSLHTAGGGDTALDVERRGGRLWIRLPALKQPGDNLVVTVQYGGRPRVAPYPPWVGGFNWATTASGDAWVAVSCQSDGADIWWPCKDHPSDEPDSMALHITVPEPLFCAANGRLREVVSNDDGTRTFHWFISNPINNYNVSLNIAPYRTIEDTYLSITGEQIPLTYWVLPENYEKGLELFPQFSEHLRFYETYLGPYPFRADKYGVAETPYLGMEHQTIIAYGHDYTNNDYGFDILHFHELAHEWWGNLVTCADWKDMWLHEGFAVYMEALYADYLHGDSALHSYMARVRPKLRNVKPVAPRESQTSLEIYFLPPDYIESDGDIYTKGACILHALRYLIGDEQFFTALRRMAYPVPALEAVTDGGQCRLVDTDDFRVLVEEITGREMGWFFDLYVHQEQLPELAVKRSRNKLRLRWKTPRRLPFPMPVPVQIGDETVRVELPKRRAVVSLPAGTQPVIDPQGWVLRAAVE